MSTRALSIDKLWRGAASVADFLAPRGFVRFAKRMRFTPRVGAVAGTGTVLKREITELDSAKTYVTTQLGNIEIVAGLDGSSNVELRCFGEDGTEGTIYKLATLGFDSGGTTEVQIGDKLRGQTSGAEGVVRGIRLTLDPTKTWAGGTAEGTFIIRFETPGTSFQNNELLDVVGGATNVATADGTESATLFSTYLGTDISKIRLLTFENLVLCLNTGKVVATSAAPAYAGTIKSRLDYEALLKAWEADVGDVYKTRASALGFPAGHYQCTAAGVESTGVEPVWKQIPKPSQADAVYDRDTVINGLSLVTESPLVMEYGQLPIPTRKSGGDVIGTDDETGEEIIRNAAELKGLTITAMALYSGPSRLAMTLSDKRMLVSRSAHYFDWWLTDVDNILPGDRIIVDVIVPDSGDVQHLVGTANGLFLQMEKGQAQFNAGGEVLVAGGEGTPYNGQLNEVGREPGLNVQGAVYGPYVVVPDAKNRLQVWWYPDDGRQFIPLAIPLSDNIADDLRTYTITQLRIIGKTLWVLTSDGRAWKFDITSVDRDRNLLGAWSEFQVESGEDIVDVWGVGDETRLLVTHGSDLSLLIHEDGEVNPDTGFTYMLRLDRRETLTADSYNSATDLTQFTTKTAGDLTRTKLQLRHDLARLEFNTGSGAGPSVGDTVTGGTSSAAGVVFRITIQSGTWAGGDAQGVLDIRKTDRTKEFADTETITIGGAETAVLTSDEIMQHELGDVISAAEIDSGNNKIVRFKGDYLGGDHFVGRTFESSIQLHTLWSKGSDAEIVVVTVSVLHERSTDYELVMRDSFGNDSIFEYASKEIGAYQHGAGALATDRFTVAAGQLGEQLSTIIRNTKGGQFRVGGIIYQIEETVVS